MVSENGPDHEKVFLVEAGFSAQFFLDYLIEDPQTHLLVSGPTSSPENSFITPDDKRACLAMGNALDQEIVWDLLTNLGLLHQNHLVTGLFF